MRCAYCDEIIEVGDTYYSVGRDHVCANCIIDYLNDWCLDGEKYVIEDEEVSEDDLNDWLIENSHICNEEEEYTDERMESYAEWNGEK